MFILMTHAWYFTNSEEYNFLILCTISSFKGKSKCCNICLCVSTIWYLILIRRKAWFFQNAYCSQLLISTQHQYIIHYPYISALFKKKNKKKTPTTTTKKKTHCAHVSPTVLPQVLLSVTKTNAAVWKLSIERNK